MQRVTAAAACSVHLPSASTNYEHGLNQAGQTTSAEMWISRGEQTGNLLDKEGWREAPGRLVYLLTASSWPARRPRA